MKRRILTLATLMLLLAVSCGTCQRAQKTAPIVRPGYHQLTLGEHSAWVRTVANNADREKGLMHVRSLPEDDGMLFVFPVKRELRFWMKNTLIPLDIAYLEDDGTIVDIVGMVPADPEVSDALLPRYPSSKAVRYALEFNAGWFERHGIVVGDRVEGVPSVKEVNPR